MLFCLAFHMQCTRWVVVNSEPLLLLQVKVLEYWSPAPLPEGDAGKKAAALANLKEPEAADLEVSLTRPSRASQTLKS